MTPKRIISGILLFAGLFLWQCNNDSTRFQTADCGLQYHFVEQYPNNRLPQKGDVVILDMKYLTEERQVLYDSEEQERDYMQKLKDAEHPGGSFQEALAMMHIGDSAVFRINAKDFYRHTLKHEKLPETIRKNGDIILHVRMKSVLKKEKYSYQVVKKYHSNEEAELELLEAYLERTNVQQEPTETGLYLVPLKKGKGPEADSGDFVAIHYTGKLIDGKVFGSSIGKSPMELQLGKGQVIQGMEEGIDMMHEGGKARLIIPSKLAYGSETKENILPYSTLIFELELLNVARR